jgi:ABC-2 type transport system permease protein
MPADMASPASPASPGSFGPGSPGSPGSPATTGVIHDLGYRRYDGPRLGRGAIIMALCWHSLRSAFGLGRGFKAKIVPFLLLAIMVLPAVVNAVAIAVTPGSAGVIHYDTYLPGVRVLVMTIFLAAQAPELVSRDLRSHVLPLYFARPMRRDDYPAAKLAALILACLVMIEVPEIVLYLGTVLQVHGVHEIWVQTRGFIPGLLVGFMWSVLLASIGLLLASLSGRRAYATGIIAIFFFLTFTLAGLLRGIAEAGRGGGFSGRGSAPAGAHLAGLVSPFTVLDGVREWLGGVTEGIVPHPTGIYGPLYGLMLLVFLAAAVAGLIIRYRKVVAA